MRTPAKILLFIAGMLGAGFLHAQNMGINTSGTTPDASAILDLNSGNAGTQGLLPEQVALTATNTAGPTTNPATGLFVYNTATAGAGATAVTPGYYYNGGTPGAPNWIRFATGGSGWLLTGNAGTVDGTNFLGTTDGIPLSFYMNNTKSGRLDFSNAFFGYQAANSNTGNSNIAIGVQAMNHNTSGSSNVSIGSQSMLWNTGGSMNTAVGLQSLYGCGGCNGNQNTAVGAYAMYATGNGATNNVGIGYYTTCGTGNNNIGIGNEALQFAGANSNNVAIGNQSMYSENNGGNDNTAVGNFAFQTVGNGGKQNTGIGSQVVGSCAVGGNNNTYLGYSAAYGSGVGMLGNNNVGLGAFALTSMKEESDNVAIGYQALFSTAFNNGSGQSSFYNVALGNGALYTLNPNNNAALGMENTALGHNAMYSLTQGNYNTGAGFQNGYFNQTGNNNTTVGFQAGYGVTTNSNSNNAYFGYWAGYGVTTGGNNTALGYQAMKSATTGSSNVAVGYNSMSSGVVTGSNNVGVGIQSLYDLTSGGGNVAVGYQSNYFNQTGSNNVTLGYYAGQGGGAVATLGDNNVFIGYGAGREVNNSSGNVGIGYYALFTSWTNPSGGKNTAVGYQALTSDGAGANNTSFGYNSMLNNWSGGNNTGIGYTALQTNSTGSNNTALGYGADVSVDGWTNSTAIGYNARTTASNQVVLGNNAVTVVGGFAAAYTNLSDRRVKKNIQADVHGLDFILKLKPVSYNYDIKEMNRHMGVNETDLKSLANAEQLRHSGFIAQEVEQAAKEVNYNFTGLKTPENDSAYYSLAYSDFVVPLVKSVQELNSRNDSLQAENKLLKQMIIQLAQTQSEMKKEMAFIQSQSSGQGTDVRIQNLQVSLEIQQQKMDALQSMITRLLIQNTGSSALVQSPK